jgi:transposase
MDASSVRRWVKHFKGGNTGIADQPCCGRPRTAAAERNTQKVELIRHDRRVTVTDTTVKLRVGHHAVQEIMEILGYREVCARWVSRLLTGSEHKMAGNFHPPYSPDLAPSDYHLIGPLKDHLKGYHYETDEAVQEAVQSWLRGAGTDLYSRGILRFCNAGRNEQIGIEIL